MEEGWSSHRFNFIGREATTEYKLCCPGKRFARTEQNSTLPLIYLYSLYTPQRLSSGTGLYSGRDVPPNHSPPPPPHTVILKHSFIDGITPYHLLLYTEAEFLVPGNRMPQSTMYPSQGISIWLLYYTLVSQIQAFTDDINLGFLPYYFTHGASLGHVQGAGLLFSIQSLGVCPVPPVMGPGINQNCTIEAENAGPRATCTFGMRKGTCTKTGNKQM